MHFPRDYEVGPHCHLVLWLTKFKSERPGSRPVIDPWPLRDIFTNPLIDQGATNGVISELGRRVREAYEAVPKDTAGTRYISPGNVQGIENAIDHYAGPHAPTPPLHPDKSYTYFFNTPPAPGSPEFVLFTRLCSHGYYVPPVHRAPRGAAADAIIQGLLEGNTTRPSMWERPFPGLYGADITLGDATYEDLYTTPAKQLWQHYRSTFDDLRQARDYGIIRGFDYQHTRGCPPPHLSPEVIASGKFEMLGPNGKCCTPESACTPINNKYCQIITGDGCNSMSDPCPTP